MIISVGSTNKAKISAVCEVIADSSFKEAKILAVKTESSVSNQPLTLEETLQGAKNRARNAFIPSSTYSIGIESGLMKVDTYMNISVCAIFDGERFYVGFSSSFEVPPILVERILNAGLDLSQACLETGVSSNVNIGSTEGLIGILTNGKIDRKAYSKECITMAMVQLEHSHLYKHLYTK
jgi:inosine/xanthosine triphosphatase